jgi:hypothetical protein
LRGQHCVEVCTALAEPVGHAVERGVAMGPGVMTLTRTPRGVSSAARVRPRQLFLRTFDDYCAGLIEAVRRALDGPGASAYERLRAHVPAVTNVGTGPDRKSLARTGRPRASIRR